MWLECIGVVVGVVVSRYIDFLILLIPTLLVLVLFAAASLLLCSLTLEAHANSEGYCSCTLCGCVCVCVCVCVHSNLPHHTLESQNRDTNGFIAIQQLF